METRKTLKTFASNWLLPPRITQKLGGLRSRGATSSRRPEPGLNQGLLALKDSQKGEKCFIVATGPSIKNQDLSVLEGHLSIGVSFLFLHELASQFKPRYHVIAPNHFPFDYDLVARYIEGLEKNYTHKCDILYGDFEYKYSIGNYLSENPYHGRHRVHLVDYASGVELSEQNHMNDAVWNLAANPFRMRTVIYGAIQLAVYIGCQEIILLGCDHDYLSDLSRTDNHFYKESEGNAADKEHLKDFTTERWFAEYHARWRDYRLMNAYCQSRGVKILNATHGGMLDMFPRVSLDSFI